MSARVPRITPFLWFDSNAEEAVEFYLSIFNNSRRLDELPNTGDVPAPKAKSDPSRLVHDGVLFSLFSQHHVGCGRLRTV